MPISISRSSTSSVITSTSTSTLSSHGTIALWDPRAVFRIQPDCRCVGWAPSRGRKCLNPISQDNLASFNKIIHKLSIRQPCPDNLHSKLRRLAAYGLCVRNHQGQVEDMVEKWEDRMMDAFPEGVVEAGRLRIMDAERSSPGVSRRSVISTSSTTSSAAIPSHSEMEALQETINAMQESIRIAQRRLVQLGYSPATTNSSRAPPASLSRVSTSDISSLQLSRSSTLNSMSSATQIRNPAPTQEPAPASAQPSVSQPSSTPSSVASATACSRPHVRRRSMDEECPICQDDDSMSTSESSDLVWCKEGCGRSVHRECFEIWRNECEASRRVLRCIMCRTQWETEECECV